MKVTVARTLDDFMKVMVIRGIIFIGEHGHRYNMEFDEHELSNRTHMLALDDTQRTHRHHAGTQGRQRCQI